MAEGQGKIGVAMSGLLGIACSVLVKAVECADQKAICAGIVALKAFINFGERFK
jgi:hypothetical protein